jgi:hypothetical protein
MNLEETVLRPSQAKLFFPGCVLYSCVGGWMARIGSLHSDDTAFVRATRASDGALGTERVGERV